MEYPYSDEHLVYDYEEHKYRLTPKFVLDKLNVDLKARLNAKGSYSVENLAQNILDQISDEIYSFIYQHNMNNELQEFILAKCPSARDMIRNAMKEQVLYFLANGDLNQYSGVNLRSGQTMENFYDKAISPIAKNILAKQLKETGVSILYQGQYKPVFMCFDYEKDRY